MAPGPGLPASQALCRPRAPAAAGDRAPECAVPGTVLLLLAYLAYLALGTGVFWVLESPAARDSSARFQRDKWALLQNFTCLDGPALDSLIRGIIQAYQNGDIVLDNTTSMGRWEFMGSFFFSVSTVTTIGYGNLSPRTMAARLFCIFFALLGIPLNLVVLNRLGHLMQRGVQRCARRLGGAWQDPTKAPWLVGAGALLSGLPLFLLLPPLLFCHVEGWSYVESFYFAFITLSTVGFGDYVIGGSQGPERISSLLSRAQGLGERALLISGSESQQIAETYLQDEGKSTRPRGIGNEEHWMDPSRRYPLWYKNTVSLWILFGMAWLALIIKLTLSLLEAPGRSYSCYHHSSKENFQPRSWRQSLDGEAEPHLPQPGCHLEEPMGITQHPEPSTQVSCCGKDS
ncbi:potassium channel subfamily K member 17 isoform X1 [Mustela putorius furo]|uniref:Potassium channel subfamily K member n=1 Tax=Mustela putorius furo TaxID=9669 RepID=A0A8U0TH15_MUSPF|nr:potassium channel subfamily K member 17 isoform X1 [Mustela putorius furo]